MARDTSQEYWDSPSDSQLKSWGISRDQYKQLYSKAEKDAKDGAFLGGLFVSVGDVNRYLKDKMVATKGSYADGTIKRTVAKTPAPAPTPGAPPVVPAPVSAPSGGTGGGSSSVVNRVEAPAPTYYDTDELAKKFGIVNDYATILKELQAATSAQFDETETTMKRAESSNLRAQESAYNQYLQDLRSRSANAVASGATKGTMAANALTSLLGFQDSNRESTNLMNDLLYETAQQRGTSLKADVTTARQQANEIGQYLGNLSTSMDTNNINKYAAELAANAQTRAASIQASATNNAAKISANAGYDKLMGWLTEYNQGDKNKALNQYFNDYYPYSIGAKVPNTNK
ncbi:MAG: hypothetical protein EOL95_10290 [Bacteroidia bacterium]|nr:hypothetical protein [Bacteroidia bacterium]